ncbi:MAG: aminopeptidase P N-terminal domain-containing protein [Trueperaceae bacterium]
MVRENERRSAEAERRARRSRVLDAMRERSDGPAVALVQGAGKNDTSDRFRQSNDMHYLCAVETPHAYLVLDARDGRAHLFLPYQSEKHRAKEGPLLHAGDLDEAAYATGVDAAHPIDALAAHLERVQELFTPFRAGEGAVQSWDTLQRAAQEALSDPWDGRPDRHRWFLGRLRERLPGARLRDLAPVLDDLRLVKSEREIAALRRSGALAARGLVAALGVTRPGAYEYELETAVQAEFFRGGARVHAYRPIVAAGDNAWYAHYQANDQQIADGDLVLLDAGPDLDHYASDVTRIWPANGRYDAVQRQLYGFMVAYHEALLRRLRPGVTAEAVQHDVAEEMLERVEATSWAKPIYEQAAVRALSFPGHLSHPVGMAVHDVGDYSGTVLRPGVALAVDPQLFVPEERRYVRVEDTVVITDEGVENLTDGVPLGLDATEALVGVG